MTVTRRWILPVLVVALASAGTNVLAAANASLALSVDPASAVRGDVVTLQVVASNATGHALEQTTLFAPLPVGIDQWEAEVRMAPWDWESFPANGLIALGTIPATGDILVELRLPVEQAAPGALLMVCQLLGLNGVLAQESCAINVLPSVDAGPDLIVDLGSEVPLSEASASDGQEEVASMVWTDNGAGGAFDDAGILHPTYSPPAISGLVELTLTVIDNDGAMASDSLRVRVNQRPMIDLGDDLFVLEGEEIDLSHALAEDADGWIAGFLWSDGGAGGTFSPSAETLDVTYSVPFFDGCEEGEITLALVATDDWGATSQDSIQVFVSNENEPPIAAAFGDEQLSPGEEGTLTGEASDPDGNIAETTWTQIGGPNVSLRSGKQDTQVVFEAPEVAEETSLTFEFAALDACGARSTATLDVVVLPREEGGDGGDSGISVGSLRATISVHDSHGFELAETDVPSPGDTILVRLSIANDTDQPLSGLQAELADGAVIRLRAASLAPWSSTDGTYEWTLEANDLLPRLEIVASARGEDARGRVYRAADAFAFVPSSDSADIALLATVSPPEAHVGDHVVYTYVVRNGGESMLEGLSLHDEGLGWIDLPGRTLAPGESWRVDVGMDVAESDLPGPLVSEAAAVGFDPSGQRVQAESSTHLDLLSSGGGGGGSVDGFRSTAPGVAGEPSVVINEIAWAGTPSDPAAEWIELLNLGTVPVDLSGWSLRWMAIGPDAASNDSSWHTIELAGIIDPPPATHSGAAIKFAESGSGIWRAFDFGWWGQGKSGDLGRGFYLLEHGSDQAVRDVSADLIYGDAFDETLLLPDSGAALFLMNASGEIVDCANAQSGLTAWLAGDAATGASMERVDPRRADYADNWQTHSGLFAFGHSADGRLLRATPGKPNAPSAAEFLDAAHAALSPTPANGRISLPLSSAGLGVLGSVQILSVADSPLGGGGGAASRAPVVTTRRDDEGLELDLDLRGVSPGEYYVCVSLANGDALIMPLIVPAE